LAGGALLGPQTTVHGFMLIVSTLFQRRSVTAQRAGDYLMPLLYTASDC